MCGSTSGYALAPLDRQGKHQAHPLKKVSLRHSGVSNHEWGSRAGIRTAKDRFTQKTLEGGTASLSPSLENPQLTIMRRCPSLAHSPTDALNKWGESEVPRTSL